MSFTKNKKMILVEKMNGDKEPYNPNKLRKSMEKVGADRGTIDKVLGKVETILYNGIKTKELFSFIHEELDKTRPGAGLKYNLKRAITEMKIEGGFIFEKFIGKVLEKQGYNVKMNQIVNGRYITHEIDISAEKSESKEKLMVEVKHHDRPWFGESIQTALYVYARFLEVKDKFTKPMLVTNTKFSNQVIKYSKGVGIRLMGWKYPYKDSLEDNIARYKLYPITILNISREKTKEHLRKGILTVQQLREQKNINSETRKQINAILNI